MADTSEVSLVSNARLETEPPVVDPTEQWIAYGVVIDEDGDGVPDWRYGIDNMPADAAEDGPPSEGGGRTFTPAKRRPAQSIGRTSG